MTPSGGALSQIPALSSFEPFLKPLTVGGSLPDADTMNAVGQHLAPYRFVHQELMGRRRRRKKTSIDSQMSFEEQVINRQEIRHRSHNRHDMLNGLVWLSLPKTKVMLHRLSYEARGPLPRQRTLVQQRFAQFDEAGVICLAPTPTAQQRLVATLADLDAADTLKEQVIMGLGLQFLVFGHGLLETLLEAPTVTPIYAMAYCMLAPQPLALPSIDQHLAVQMSKQQEFLYGRHWGSLSARLLSRTDVIFVHSSLPHNNSVLTLDTCK
jgi:hypothetical protein